MDSNIYKIAVVATMSSGKSTFINSLIGNEILSVRNMACTANVVEIANKDNENKFKAKITNKNGSRSSIEVGDTECMDKFNNGELEDLSLEGSFYNIRNGEKKLVIVDTPGVNNSRDLNHKKITYEFLEKFDGEMLIYVINATQFGTDDDFKLLSKIAQIVKRKNLKLLVLINKIDEFDVLNESINELIGEVYSYVGQFNMPNVDIILVASLAALLFRKLLNNNETFTRKDKMNLLKMEELFSNEKSLLEFSKLLEKNVDNNKQKILRKKVEEAVSKTGIEKVEKIVMKELGCTENEIESNFIKSSIEHDTLQVRRIKENEIDGKLRGKNQGEYEKEKRKRKYKEKRRKNQKEKRRKKRKEKRK